MDHLILAIVSLFKGVPPKAVPLLGLAIGWVLYRVVRFRRRVVTSQIELAYGHSLSASELCRLVRDHYRHLGMLAVELLRLPGARRDRDLEQRLRIHGLRHLDEAIGQGRGVIVISGHCGNWEMCGLAMARKNYNVTAVGKEMTTKAGESFRELIRDKNGIPTIPRRNSLRKILKALKNQALVVFMIDQNMTAEEGVFVDFFGHRACTLTAAAVLAERTGAAVVPGFTWRDEDFMTHHCEIRPPCDLSAIDGSGSRAERVQRLTQHFNHELEAMINQHPEQWMWIHKRWRTRPAGEAAPPIQYPRRRQRRRHHRSKA